MNITDDTQIESLTRNNDIKTLYLKINLKTHKSITKKEETINNYEGNRIIEKSSVEEGLVYRTKNSMGENIRNGKRT